MYFIMGISDYLVQLEELTNTNLKLLTALNESINTDKNHVSVDLGNDGAFTIPTFLNLENKINALQNNFENLVKSPITGEANFIFNGDSRTIELKRYEQAPAPVSLKEPVNFYHENNDILKDFITPVPYLKFDISNIPNDINTFIVRKVAAVSNIAKERFNQSLNDAASKSLNWGDLYKLISDLNQDEDYVLYDTNTRLPVREGQGDGVYVIKSIDDDYIDENLDQHVILTLANNLTNPIYKNTLTYTIFDQTIEKKLNIGDYLVSFDGHAKFQIENLNFDSNTIKLKIMYGEYINLVPWSGNNEIDESSKLRFFSGVDPFSSLNYIKVPLEEDQYIYVALAALNDRMNIRASWGDGVVINTNKLTMAKNDKVIGFRDYYDNCRNIGDILNEISKVMSNTTTSHSTSELNSYMSAKPVLDPDIVKVVHINKHLDESTTIKNIRALYGQKNNYNASLTETQNSLTSLQEQLSAIDFQDTTGIRAKIQNQIDELTKQKNELTNSLIKISDEIALTANNSIVPIENAKYRIRGFFDFKHFIDTLKTDTGYEDISEENIKGIYVQYRYRNIQLETGSATTFTKDYDGDGIEENEVFIYSDWNQLYTPLRLRIRNQDGTYGVEEDTSNQNSPSFNQIDIPISQGENVDVRLKVIYDFGYPFIQMMSDWSDIVTFEFPDEFLKDVQITTIIEENNNDIETNRFNSILSNNGVTKHVEDLILDQDVTFFHKPENISSGFYTPERRIIPLRDKLKSMDDSITRIVDEIEGSSSENLSVFIDYDESSVQLSPFEVGHIMLKGYNSFGSDTSSYGNYEKDSNGVIRLACNIRLVNTSQHSLKIFPMFPGTDGTILNKLKYSKFDTSDYCITCGSSSYEKCSSTPGDTSSYTSKNGLDPNINSNANNIKIPTMGPSGQSGDPSNYDYYDLKNTPYYGGVWIKNPDGKFSLQTTNQILTYRINNLYNGDKYYKSPYVETIDGETISGSLDYILNVKPNGTSVVAANNLFNGSSNTAWQTAAEFNKLFATTENMNIFSEIYAGASGAGSTTNYPLSFKYCYGMNVYPYNSKTNGLLMTFKDASNYMLLNPGDEYIFPFVVEYRLNNGTTSSSTTSVNPAVAVTSIEKTISFDIRTSLYNDPLNYTLKIGAKYAEEASDKLVSSLNKKYNSTAMSNKEYIPIVR